MNPSSTIRPRRTLVATQGLCLLTASMVLATDFTISRSTIGGGSGLGTGGDFELTGTVIPASATGTGGSFDLTGGFWFSLTPGDCAEDGGVGLRDYEGFPVCVTGPGEAVQYADCTCLDFDADGDVDLADVAAFQSAFTGR